MPTIVITGVSTGIGEACARLWAGSGWTVVGSVRDPAVYAQKEWGGDVRLEPLDLRQVGAGAEFARRVIAAHGVPDIVLNNAGTLRFGPTEEADLGDVLEVYQVNVFSQLEIVQVFSAAFRERGSGIIANVTSLGGRLVFPFFGIYNSSKHALEGLSEGLWHELRPFGVRVKLIEPGFVETPIYSKAMGAAELTDREARSPYAEYLRGMRAFEGRIKARTSPDDAALEIKRAVDDPSDRLRYPVAAYARSLVLLRRLVGDQAFMRFFGRSWMSSQR